MLTSVVANELEQDWDFLDSGTPQAHVEQVESKFEAAVQEDGSETEDTTDDEIDRRLAMVEYYRVLRGGAFFEEDNSPAALAVTKEIQGFVAQRVKILLNLGGAQPVVEAQFTELEAKVLKRIAQEALARPQLLGKTGKIGAEPVKGKPKLKQFSAPGHKAVRQSEPESPKPVVKPATQPAPKPVQKAPQSPTPALAPAETGGEPQSPKGFPPDGAVIVSRGRRYRVNHVEVAVEECSPNLQQALYKMEIGQPQTFSDGSQVCRTGMSTWVKAARKDLTLQKVDPTVSRMPFPNSQRDMELAVAALASKSEHVTETNLKRFQAGAPISAGDVK